MIKFVSALTTTNEGQQAFSMNARGVEKRANKRHKRQDETHEFAPNVAPVMVDTLTSIIGQWMDQFGAWYTVACDGDGALTCTVVKHYNSGREKTTREKKTLGLIKLVEASLDNPARVPSAPSHSDPPHDELERTLNGVRPPRKANGALGRRTARIAGNSTAGRRTAGRRMARFHRGLHRRRLTRIRHTTSWSGHRRCLTRSFGSRSSCWRSWVLPLTPKGELAFYALPSSSI
jgi:hypothetical protein